jgi:hypothetical protein
MCGGSLEGDFTWMLNEVDFCTQCVEASALWNCGWYNTLEQLRVIEGALPFALRGVTATAQLACPAATAKPSASSCR